MAMTSSGTATVTLPTDTQILTTRELVAPKHLVYKAWTRPELVRRWWHANRGEMTTCEIDLSVGGTWRYVMVAEGGSEVGFHGEYRKIVPNECLVSTGRTCCAVPVRATAAVGCSSRSLLPRWSSSWNRLCIRRRSRLLPRQGLHRPASPGRHTEQPASGKLEIFYWGHGDPGTSPETALGSWRGRTPTGG